MVVLQETIPIQLALITHSSSQEYMLEQMYIYNGFYIFPRNDEIVP